MAHTYSGKTLRSRPGIFPPLVNTVLAHTAWWAAFGFAAAMVLGLF